MKDGRRGPLLVLAGALMMLTLQGVAHAAQPAARRNHCEVVPMDMAFLGEEGHITDRNRALLVVDCSKPPASLDGSAIETCLKVQGPATHSFANIGFSDARKTSFQTFLSWERDYLGNVSVALDCPLQDVASNRLAMPTAPLRFTVVPNVAERLSLQHGGADGAHAPAPAPALAAAL